MGKFEFSPTITLGGVLQIMAILLGIGSAYVAVAQKDIQHDERIAFNASESRRIEARIDVDILDTKRELEKMNQNLVNLNENIFNHVISDLRNQVNKNAQSRDMEARPPQTQRQNEYRPSTR